MARTPGNSNVSYNFEVFKEGPFDARLVCPTYLDLLGDETPLPLPYLGMVVAVTEDADATKNGVYVRVANPGVEGASLDTDWKKIDGKITDFAVYPTGLTDDPDTGVPYDEPVLRITESNGGAPDLYWEVPLSDIGAAGYNAAGCHKFTIGAGDLSSISVGDATESDIAFVIDGSGSIGQSNWPLVINGVKSILEELNTLGYFTSGAVKCALTEFGNCGDAAVISSLTDDYNSLITTLDNLSFPSHGSTKPAPAFDLAYKEINGVNSRSGANKLIVTLTDGGLSDLKLFDGQDTTDPIVKCQPLGLSSGEMAKDIQNGSYAPSVVDVDDNIQSLILGIGIGIGTNSAGGTGDGTSFDELTYVSSNPGTNNPDQTVYIASNFTDFEEVVAPAVSETIATFVAPGEAGQILLDQTLFADNGEGVNCIDTCTESSITISLGNVDALGCDVSGWLQSIGVGGYVTFYSSQAECENDVVVAGTITDYQVSNGFGILTMDVTTCGTLCEGQEVIFCHTGGGSGSGSGSSSCFTWRYDGATTDGIGLDISGIRFNNTNLNQASEIYISTTSKELNNWTDYFNKMLGMCATLTVVEKNNPSKYVIYDFNPANSSLTDGVLTFAVQNIVAGQIGQLVDENEGTDEYTPADKTDLCLTFDLFRCSDYVDPEPTSWKCIEGTCVDQNGPGGQYLTLQDCEDACTGLTTSYNCVDGNNCEQVLDETGQYQTLAECQVACGDPLPNVCKSLLYQFSTTTGTVQNPAGTVNTSILTDNSSNGQFTLLTTELEQGSTATIGDNDLFVGDEVRVKMSYDSVWGINVAMAPGNINVQFDQVTINGQYIGTGFSLCILNGTMQSTNPSLDPNGQSFRIFTAIVSYTAVNYNAANNGIEDDSYYCIKISPADCDRLAGGGDDPIDPDDPITGFCGGHTSGLYGMLNGHEATISPGSAAGTICGAKLIADGSDIFDNGTEPTATTLTGVQDLANSPIFLSTIILQDPDYAAIHTAYNALNPGDTIRVYHQGGTGADTNLQLGDWIDFTYLETAEDQDYQNSTCAQGQQDLTRYIFKVIPVDFSNHMMYRIFKDRARLCFEINPAQPLPTPDYNATAKAVDGTGTPTDDGQTVISDASGSRGSGAIDISIINTDLFNVNFEDTFSAASSNSYIKISKGLKRSGSSEYAIYPLNSVSTASGASGISAIEINSYVYATSGFSDIALGEAYSISLFYSGDAGPQGDTGAEGAQGVQGLEGAKGDTGAQGNTGDIGAQGVQGLEGAKGDTGAQGNTGDIGAQGVQGLEGAKGDTGAQGNTGDIGAQGVQGLEGAKGDTGAQGNTGDIGAQGVQGLEGAKGDTGAQGNTGDIGAQGVQGLEGAKGDTGAQGNTGDIGAQGVQGLEGAKGDTGAQGNTGDIGAQGVQGLEGAKGDTGAQGNTGDIGAQGVQGLEGAKGDTGAQGNTGDIGAQGVQGLEGAKGDTGAQGNTGDIGAQGVQGLEGAKGDTGAQGNTGDIGAQGVQGLEGAKGDTGAQGNTGDIGAQGVQGLEGAKGDTGAQGNTGDIGAQGVQGLEGAKGDTGAQGNTGDIGAQGVQGLEGAKGDTGAQGNTGDIGAQGVQGLEGAKGDTGAQGNTGDIGAQGVQGLEGAKGDTGAQGNTGDIGAQGVQGLEGAKGDTGAQGNTGDIGAQGVQGLEGAKGDTGAQGNTGDIGAQGVQGLEGAKGDTGAQGNTGDIGAQGVQGLEGAKGDTGAQGNTGDIGAQGVQGLEGAKGDTGAQGNTGDIGAQGVQGLEGAKGDTGAQGNTGDIGAQGVQGLEGAKGDTGAQGNTGDIGAQGVQGLEGAKGDTGAQGNTGDIGAQGVQGLEGAKGDTGAQGNTGDIGAQGVQGLEGAKGDTGAQGNTGDIGAQGVQGLEGAKGDTGAQGNTGDIGAQGVQGLEGAKGDTGAQGNTGDIGAQGVQGLEGAKGDTGAQGNTGDIGAQGVQGLEGAKGDTGAQGNTGDIGAQGVQGLEGAKGDTGAQGNTGDIGAQGVQGLEGAKGDTGAQGNTGDIGAQGVQGLEGAKGDTGAQGNTGDIGAQGVQGLEGGKGDTGAQGNTGDIGAQGVQGLVGGKGDTGAQGNTGDIGAQGVQGLEGGKR